MFKNLKRMLSKKLDIESEVIEQEVQDDMMSSDELTEQTKFTELSDSDYLITDPLAVGYADIDQQYSTYSLILSILPNDSVSILDFGCARGDFAEFLIDQRWDDGGRYDYTGIDFNAPLIDAGLSYGNRKLLLMDWFELPSELTADWCTNINSCNMRYDATSITDFEYLKRTIRVMYQHATEGVIVLLTSAVSTYTYDDGLINWNPGDVFNWAQSTFGQVVLDHTFADNSFTLIIYK